LEDSADRWTLCFGGSRSTKGTVPSGQQVSLRIINGFWGEEVKRHIDPSGSVFGSLDGLPYDKGKPVVGRYDKTHFERRKPMKKDLTGHFDRAMEEVASQRELFWQPKKRKLKSLPLEWREAIERGEELLRDAQRRKIESNLSFPLL